MSKKIKLFLATGLLALPTLVTAAEGLGYTNVEVDYINLSIDPYDEDGTLLEDFDDGNGAAIRASFAVTDRIFIFGGYSVVDSEATFVDQGTELFSSDRDVKRFDLGAGFNIPLSNSTRTDFVGRFAYSDVDFGDFDFGAGNDTGLNDLNEDSSDGFFIDGLLRSQITDMIEVSGGARYTEIEDADSLSFIGNVMYEFTPNWGVNLEVDVGDDISQVFLGARYTFGR